MSKFTGSVSEKNIFFTIWFRPKEILQYILSYCGTRHVRELFILGGICSSIDRASSRNLGDHFSTGVVLLIAVIGGGLLGWISYWIYAWLLSMTGRWLKGNADPEKFRVVIAWALLPRLLGLLLLIPELLIFGDALFRQEMENTDPVRAVLFMLFGLIESGLSIWSVTILIKGVSIAQGFGSGKSILNTILPGLLLFAIFYFLILIPGAL